MNDLTEIKGEPTILTVDLLLEELTFQASRTSSTRGGGKAGHTALTMTKEAYFKIFKVHFEYPVVPAKPPTIGFGESHAELIRVFHETKSDLTLLNEVDVELKGLIIKAVKGKYLKAKKHKLVSFLNVTTLELIQHLQTYCNMSPTEVLENDTKMKGEPWLIETGFDELINKMESHQDFSNKPGGIPITDAVLCIVAFQHVKNTGIFTYYCQQWMDKQQPDQHDWAKFKEHFRTATTNVKEFATTSSTGYHAANHTQQAPATPAPPSTEPPAWFTAHLAQGASAIPAAKKTWPILSYCWSHGYSTVAPEKHNSTNCRNKDPGHQDNATAENIMGGSVKGKR